MTALGLAILGLGALMGVVLIAFWMWLRTELEWKQPIDLVDRHEKRNPTNRRKSKVGFEMSFMRNLLADPKVRNALVGLVFAVAGYIAGAILGGAPPTP